MADTKSTASRRRPAPKRTNTDHGASACCYLRSLERYQNLILILSSGALATMIFGYKDLKKMGDCKECLFVAFGLLALALICSLANTLLTTHAHEEKLRKLVKKGSDTNHFPMPKNFRKPVMFLNHLSLAATAIALIVLSGFVWS